MYYMKCIINHEAGIILPECMYRVKNIYKFDKEDEINIGISDQVNKLLKTPNKNMTELEKRQELLLNRLDVLYERIMAISHNCYPISNKDAINTEKKFQIPVPEEVVLIVSPENIPWYLIHILKKCSAINVTWHIHSSVPNEKINKIQEFLKKVNISNIRNTKVNFRLIFKSVSGDSALRLSSLSVPIIGNVNILRYMAFIYPALIPYNPEDYKMDNLLDLCHLLERSFDKNKEAIISQLFSQCKDWIYNSEFTIVDLAAFNVIKQCRSTSKNVPKEWLIRCESLCS